MNRESILEMSRQENKNKDLVGSIEFDFLYCADCYSGNMQLGTLCNYYIL